MAVNTPGLFGMPAQAYLTNDPNAPGTWNLFDQGRAAGLSQFDIAMEEIEIQREEMRAREDQFQRSFSLQTRRVGLQESQQAFFEEQAVANAKKWETVYEEYLKGIGGSGGGGTVGSGVPQSSESIAISGFDRSLKPRP